MKIFYSWQSDLPNKTNRGLVQDALVAAVGHESPSQPRRRLAAGEDFVIESLDVVDRDKDEAEINDE